MASTGLGGSHDTVLGVELALNNIMLVGGPEGTTEHYHRNIIQNLNYTVHMHTAVYMKQPVSHQIQA